MTTSTTRNLTINTNTARSYFKFYTNTSYDGDVDISTINAIGVALGSNASFVYPTSDIVRSQEYLNELAKNIFGSNEASDFFTNVTNIHSSWDSSVSSALSTLNANVSTNGVDASEELVSLMLTNTPNRFTLAYNASITGTSLTSGTGLSVTTIYGGGSGAYVDTSLSMGNILDNLVVTTTGSGYASGSQIKIECPDGANYIELTLNSVQAAVLNGTINNSNIPTQVPLETNDVIRMIFSINTNGSQTNLNNDSVSFTQTFYVDYTLN